MPCTEIRFVIYFKANGLLFDVEVRSVLHTVRKYLTVIISFTVSFLMKLRISVIEGLVRRYCGFTQDIRLIFGRDVPFCLGDSDHLSLVLNRVRHLSRL